MKQIAFKRLIYACGGALLALMTILGLFCPLVDSGAGADMSGFAALGQGDPLCALILAAGVAAFAVACFMLFLGEDAALEKTFYLSIVVLLTLQLSYLIYGVSALSAMGEAETNLYTLSFLPLILGAVITAAAFVLLAKVKETEPSKPSDVDFESLKKCKELLDAGVVTEAEFAALKEKFLPAAAQENAAPQEKADAE